MLVASSASAEFPCCTSKVQQTLGHSSSSSEWVKCWEVPAFDLKMNYTWHTDLPDKVEPKSQWDFTLLEKRHRYDERAGAVLGGLVGSVSSIF